jgi:signal transduction histidine kinase
VAERRSRRSAHPVDNALLPQAGRRPGELERLCRADEMLYRSLHTDEVLRALVEIATDVLEADGSLVLVWDSTAQRLVPGASGGFGPGGPPRWVLAACERIFKRAAVDRVPIVVHRLTSDPRVRTHLGNVGESERKRSQISVPIKLPDEVVGVFSVICSAARASSADHQQLVQVLAQHAALAIRNARLYEQARQEINTREEVLETASHELRNPLANIKGFVSTLQRTDLEWDRSTRSDFLSEIEQAAGRIEKLADDLLDIARLENEEAAEQARSTVPPSAIVAGGLDRVRRKLVGREVAVKIPDDLPDIEVDAGRVERVLANLVDNAVKYSPAGTVVQVVGRPVDGKVELAVEDEGPGIAAEHLDRIFDKFFRDRIADNVAGTGLGLSICRTIMRAEGGAIWAENRPTGGARFVVTFPARNRKPISRTKRAKSAPGFRQSARTSYGRRPRDKGLTGR